MKAGTGADCKKKRAGKSGRRKDGEWKTPPHTAGRRPDYDALIGCSGGMLLKDVKLVSIREKETRDAGIIVNIAFEVCDRDFTDVRTDQGRFRGPVAVFLQKMPFRHG